MTFLVPIVIEASLKAAGIFLLAGLTTWAIRSSTAAARHLVRSGAVPAALMMPLLVCLLPVAMLQAKPSAEPDASLPQHSVQIDRDLHWRFSRWAGQGHTHYTWIERRDDATAFINGDPGRRHVWAYYFGTPVDVERYPRLVMRYRARHTDPDSGRYVIWLDDTTGPNRGGIRPIASRDLIADGQVHQLTRDLRDLNPAGEITGMALGVHADEQGPAVLELLELRFEAADDQQQAIPDGEPIAVEVLDGAGQPVADAVVSVDAERPNWARTVLTNAKGQAVVTPLANRFGRHMVRVSKPGMTRVELRDTSGMIPGEPIRFVLHAAETYSGRVMDEQGQPVPNVVVDPWTRGTAAGREQPQLVAPLRAVTDARGRWEMPGIAVGYGRVTMRLIHPDYLSDRWGGQSATPTEAQFQAGTAEMVLKQGVRVQGVVLTADGQPIAGARVAQGHDQFPTNAPPTARTDQQGQFLFEQAEPGALTLTVTASGHHPELLDTTAQADMDPIEIRLGEPAAVRFRVVDEQGEPVADATIVADTWRGIRTLGWSGRTDASGQLTWTSAPRDVVQYDVYKQGYMRISNHPIEPGEQETVLTLTAPWTVTGRVTDAATGEPIERFTVIEGIGWENRGNVVWQRQNVRTFENGRYEWTAQFPYPRRFVRIEAPGYRPAESDAIRGDGGEYRLDFALEKGGPLTGLVHLPDGQPAGGATVILALPGQPVMIISGKEVQTPSPRTMVDGAGRFEFPAEDGPFLVVVLHDAGYAEQTSAKLADGEPIVLQPWGQVEGVAHVGSEPAAGWQVAIMFDQGSGPDRSQPRVHHVLQSQTDAAGRFMFDRVKPGSAQVAVGERIEIGRGMGRIVFNQRQWVEIQPGQVTRVQLGGSGREVIGRVELPGHEDVNWQSAHASIRQVAPAMPRPPLPEGWAAMSNQQRQAWYEQWQLTDEGQAFEQRRQAAMRQQRNYSFVIQPDGSFRVPDVAAGTYQLTVRAQRPQGDLARNHLGSAERMIEITNDQAAGPVDLGTIQLTPHQTPEEQGS